LNLKVYSGESLVFKHDGKWLHPLFALEDFLKDSNLKSESLSLEDKLIGRAAAVLIVRMGIKKCHAGTMSSRAVSFLEKTDVTWSYDHIVERLECQTEMILSDDMSLEDSYTELARRAGRS